MKTKFWLIQVDVKSDREIYDKIMNLARNFGEGEAKSGGNSEILKVQFFFSILLPIFGIRGENWSPAKCKGVF